MTDLKRCRCGALIEAGCFWCNLEVAILHIPAGKQVKYSYVKQESRRREKMLRDLEALINAH